MQLKKTSQASTRPKARRKIAEWRKRHPRLGSSARGNTRPMLAWGGWRESKCSGSRLFMGRVKRNAPAARTPGHPLT